MTATTDAPIWRLRSRPGVAPPANAPVGLRRLGPFAGRDGLVYVPPNYRRDRAVRVVVLCHGAGATAQAALVPLLDHADDCNLVLVAPQSRDVTWDLLLGDIGADLATLDRMLADVFAGYAIEAGGVTIGGFSDGASYALSIGLANGDVFDRVLAFSPGFVLPPEQVGRPQVFVAHGVHDEVLPVDRCGRHVVRTLTDDGYDVRYVEFDGGHGMPVEVVAQALDWLGAC